MEDEILAFVNDFNGIDKDTIEQMKAQKIVAGSVVKVCEIVPAGDLFGVEVVGKAGTKFLLNGNNVTLFKSYDDDYRVYEPEIATSQIEK